MYHPVKRVKDFLAALRLAITTFQRLGLALLTALDKQRVALEQNTASAEQLLATAKETLAAARATQAAVTYLKLAEQHKREQSGLRTEFIN